MPSSHDQVCTLDIETRYRQDSTSVRLESIIKGNEENFSLCLLTFKKVIKKSIVNNVPVNGSNFISPETTTEKKCKIATKMSALITRIHGTRNSLWSFLKPIKTRIDETDPKIAQPRNIMLNITFAAC